MLYIALTSCDYTLHLLPSQAMYLPWILLLFNFILHGRWAMKHQHLVCTHFFLHACENMLPSLSPPHTNYSSFWSDLVGILAGHLYFFVMFKYPQDFGGQVLLSTPQILWVLYIAPLYCTLSMAGSYIIHRQCRYVCVLVVTWTDTWSSRYLLLSSLT